MPELPDVENYVHALARRVHGRTLLGVRLHSPFLLRTVEPPLTAAAGKAVTGVGRLGKRVVLALEEELFLAVHLMIAGRLHWRLPGARPAGKQVLAAFDFEEGRLTLTEAGSKRRAMLHLVQGRSALDTLSPGGVEPLECTPEQFREALTRENHTLKRALTDPRLFSGIGNSYSDEILHRARLSPLRLTQRLTGEEVARLGLACREVLTEWTERLRAETGDGFPERVTAFRPEMAVHGRYGQPCPDCGAPVQRIRYAENECNYCARCQNEDRVLADRGLSRLLREDWPRTLEALEGRGILPRRPA